MLIEDVESIERYSFGGYHPIVIGEKLNNGRYQIVHKLGFGGYSTIWLAKDQITGRYVAVKVAISECDSHESQILKQLKAEKPAVRHPAEAMIPSVFDEFTVKGPNGEHRCMVTEPARASLANVLDPSYPTDIFQLPVSRAIVAQLVQAVAFLHFRGIVHAGMICLFL